MESILTSIKKLLGIEAEITHFDQDLIIFINGALFTLNQLGVGPKDGFVIYDASSLWAEFLSERKDMEAVKTYVHLKVRLVFDPPTNSFLIKAIKDQIDEYEWRLCHKAESTSTTTTTVEGGTVSE